MVNRAAAPSMSGKIQLSQRDKGLIARRRGVAATARGVTRRIFGSDTNSITGAKIPMLKNNHGGARPGAGRPKGAKNRPRFESPEQAEQYANAEMPLDYMLAVMRDPLADWKRRDKMAKAAALFVHAKITSDAKPARRAGRGCGADGRSR